MSELPWVCPDHPIAQIRHEWNQSTMTVRLTGASTSWKETGTDQYFCAACGRELADDPEITKASKRQSNGRQY